MGRARRHRLDRAAAEAEWVLERPRGLRRVLAHLRAVGELHEQRLASHGAPRSDRQSIPARRF
jgi:hypothetical protein